jgi:3-dehydrosphinganine reductase
LIKIYFSRNFVDIDTIWFLMVFSVCVFSLEVCAAAIGGFVLLVMVVSFITTARFDYTNKHVLVTGGSSGIGLESAREYLKRGANVTIMARDGKKLEAARLELIASIRSSTNVKSKNPMNPEGRVACVQGDSGSSLELVEKALAPCIKQFGDVDVLVNCAGTSVAGAFDTLDPKEFERMLRVMQVDMVVFNFSLFCSNDFGEWGLCLTILVLVVNFNCFALLLQVNVLGSIYPTRAVLAGMKRKGGGRIVFVASQVAQVLK